MSRQRGLYAHVKGVTEAVDELRIHIKRRGLGLWGVRPLVRC